MHDVFGNCVAIARFEDKAPKLTFDSRIRLDHSADHSPDFQIEDVAKSYPFAYSADEMPDLLPYLQRHHPDPAGQLESWARQFLRQGGPTATGELPKTLTYAIKDGFGYARRS